MDAVELFTRGWPYALAAAPGAWAVWKSWEGGRKANRKERVDLVKIAQDVAAEAIESLKARLAEIEREFETFRKRHDDMIEAKDAKIALLEQKLELRDGEVRQLRATVESYDRLLTEKGIDHIPPTATVWQAKGGRMLLASGPLPEANL